MARHIILVGIPGSGKSTVGRLLAERMGRRFVDLDARIEQRTGLRIREVFARHGEARFRELEREATEEIARTDEALIVAPGGGWITVPGLVSVVRPPSVLVWLRCSAPVALARLGTDVSTRPLLAGPDPLAALTAISATREAFYLQSDHAVSVDSMTPVETATAIVMLAGA